MAATVNASGLSTSDGSLLYSTGANGIGAFQPNNGNSTSYTRGTNYTASAAGMPAGYSGTWKCMGLVFSYQRCACSTPTYIHLFVRVA